jgi:hypothetical protein
MLSVIFNFVLSNPGKVYSHIIEPIFFAVVTFFVTRRWNLKGLVSILIVYLIPLVLLAIVGFFEYGIHTSYRIISKPILYQIWLYSLGGIILGYITELMVKHVSNTKNRINGNA